MRLQSIASCLVVGIAGTALVSCGGGGGGGISGKGLVSLLTTSAPAGDTGVAYAMQFDASFPNAPGSFLVTGGALPTGLALDHYTGVLSGYPRQTGIFHFELAARDGVDLSLPPGRDANFAEARQTITLDIGLGLPNILPQQPPAAQYRASYAYQIDVAGGTAPYTFAQTGGSLPAGLSVSSTGLLSNFPTQSQAAPYSFDVTVTDANGFTDTETLTVQVIVLPLLILTSNPIPQAALGFPYDLPLVLASGGGGAPYIWTQTPPGPGETNLTSIGLQVTSTGHVSDLGAGPTALGTFLFTVRVVDEPLQVASRQLTLQVNPGPVLSNINPKSTAVSGPYTVTGLNFQPNAKLYFKPGATETIVTPTFVGPTTLQFNSPVPKPSNGSGAVPVMVKNPDGGSFTLNAAFVFPATTLAFGTKGFVASALSSTGLDVADVNGDGRADIVHCGSSGQTVYSGGPTSNAAGIILLINQGGSPPTFAATTLDSSSYTDVKFADVNTDGRLDIVAITQTTIRTWINNPLGTFTAGPTSALAGPGGTAWPSQMTVGKFNSDAIPDLAFGVPHYPVANTTGRVYAMAGTGTGAFTVLDATVSGMPTTYGVIAISSVDSDGDGRTEILAGIGMNPSSGPMFNYTATGATGLFSGWSARGATVGPPYYATTTGFATGDFFGSGSQTAAALMSGSPAYSNFQVMALFSGAGLNTRTVLPTPNNSGKGIAALDGDFDAKLEIVAATQTSNLVVYRGSTQTIALTLDAAAGSPAISSPRTGRVACGDINGDGMPDIVATTSYWAVNGMASNYGSTYGAGTCGNGGQMGLVFFLNTSN